VTRRRRRRTASRLAEEEGLHYDLANARSGNTLDAHRLIHLAAATGGPTAQGAMKERLLAAYFTERQPIGDRETLVRLGDGAGPGEADIRALFAGDDLVAAVRRRDDARTLGVSGVPFFAVDRAYGASGAQPPRSCWPLLDTAQAASHRWAPRPDPPSCPRPLGVGRGRSAARSDPGSDLGGRG
jgi:predicted DsbA family dithiol-disulfide isomerase